jgi:hypothetical protein
MEAQLVPQYVAAHRELAAYASAQVSLRMCTRTHSARMALPHT